MIWFALTQLIEGLLEEPQVKRNPELNFSILLPLLRTSTNELDFKDINGFTLIKVFVEKDFQQKGTKS